MFRGNLGEDKVGEGNVAKGNVGVGNDVNEIISADQRPPVT